MPAKAGIQVIASVGLSRGTARAVEVRGGSLDPRFRGGDTPACGSRPVSAASRDPSGRPILSVLLEAAIRSGAVGKSINSSNRPPQRSSEGATLTNRSSRPLR
jgi:hypothetical protein